MTEQQQGGPPQQQAPESGAQGGAQGGQQPAQAGSLEHRVGAIETEQQRQGGMLAEIRDKILGGGEPASNLGAKREAEDSGLSVAEQVRRGVAEIEAKRKKETAAKEVADKDQAWRKSVDDRLAERRPAEPGTGIRARIQRAMFGSDDKR